MGDDIMKVRSIANPDFQVSKLERETLHDRAYLELKKAIMSGAIRPGATITIRAMATALGTSPMPVREALRRLVAERALEMLPTRSVTLPLMTAERFDEISRLRIALEGLATEAGAQHLSREALRRLQQAHTEMNRMKNVGEYLAKNQEFHFTLYQAAGMPIAGQMIESPLASGWAAAQPRHRRIWLRGGPRTTTASSWTISPSTTSKVPAAPSKPTSLMPRGSSAPISPPAPRPPRPADRLAGFGAPW